MKVLLIDPPFYKFIKYYNRYFPLGLAYLAAVLRDKGHQVLIYDADANVDKACQMDYSDLESKYPEYIKCINNISHPIWNELRDTLNEIKPDLVGINVFTTKAAAAFRVAEIVKTLFNNVPVVVGGPHPSVKADELLRISPFVDYAVRGEGESCFSQLVDALEKKELPNNILGLSFKMNGQIHHNPDTEFIQDLNQIPYPAKDLLINKNSYTSEDMGLIMTGRGCPFACTFCSSAGVWQRVTRFRSVENVIGEIQQVQAKYGTIQFSFKDDTFTVDRKRVFKFCSSIKNNNLKINWECNARINLIDESLLEEMKSAGCNSIKIGIESGSNRVLQTIMKKGITTTQIKQATKLINKVGIHWTGYFLMGIPTETKQEMLQTLNLMLHIKPDFASLSVFEPYPGTELLDMGIAAGYMIDDRTLDDYYSISPKYYSMKRSNNRIDTMTNEELEQIEKYLKTSFHKYNRGTARILKRARARSILYRKDPAALFGDVRKFLAWLR
jgi:radical SAM superfamily enzyme YgiQ (UPF0313 family)